MDFSTKYTVRTDLADELVEQARQKKGKIGDGILFETQCINGIKVDCITVESDLAAKEIGKPKGRYATVETGEIWKKTKTELENTAKTVSEVVKDMMPKDGLCLVAGLGNVKITADAIGPVAADNIIVTRHIKNENKALYDSLGFGECACIKPGVTGDTGAQAFELIKGAADVLKPSCVVVVDALAARNTQRLAKTVQICDSGILPGSGVGNARHEISRRTLGVPTISVGVPTVVEAQSLCLDMLSDVLEGEKEIYNYIEEKLSGSIHRFFVCPKETDRIIKCMAKLVGYSLNFAIHKDITVDEMDEFLS